MNEQEYRYFFEVAKTRNFSMAAESLFISQSALSHCISKLEQEFQTPLFVRGRRDVQLTRAGLALLNNYPMVQQANRTLNSLVRNAAQGVCARLNVGMQDGQMVTPGIKRTLRGFQGAVENVDIQVSSFLYNELFDLLGKQELDLAFALFFPNNSTPDIEQRVFERRRSHALVSRDHPAASARDPAEGLRMLNGLDLMLVEWSIVPNVTNYIFHQCIANGFEPANIHYAPSYTTLYDWLIMEKGFVLMSEGAIFSDQDIRYIPLLQEKDIDFCVYWHRNSSNPAVEQFLEYLSKGESKP